MYKINGRFVDENNETKGYYLVSDNEEKLKASIKYTTELAGKGLVENAKVQSTRDGKLILRGKLLNLTKLPIIRGRVAGIKVVGESVFTGIIYKKNSVAGYVVRNAKGTKSRLSYKKVVDLVVGNYIGNAEANMDIHGKVSIKCDESTLDKYYMDKDNKIYKKGKAGVKMRAIKQSSGGIINGEPFDRGDYLVCGYLGEIEIYKTEEFERKFIRSEEAVAICDLHIDDVDLQIERFDTSVEKVEPNEIKSWLIFEQSLDNKEKDILLERK